MSEPAAAAAEDVGSSVTFSTILDQAHTTLDNVSCKHYITTLLEHRMIVIVLLLTVAEGQAEGCSLLGRACETVERRAVRS
jgi:hypothetical protein